MSRSIVFLDRDTLAPSVNLRRPAFDHRWTEHGRTPAEAVAERSADADIVISNKVPLRADALTQLPNLKMIAAAATGTDMIDLDACRERGIVVSNIRGYAVRTVPEHTFALILALRRNILAYHESVRRGRWQEAKQFCFFDHPIADLHGSRIGIIGEGANGQGVAALARAFGMTVMFAAHKGVSGLGPLYTPWDDVLATADVITLHCPLTPATRGMIAMAEFRAMCRRPIVVNTARGGLIDEADMATALREGLIAGAAVDTTQPEPPPSDSPLMQLLDHPRFILTPHVAWASREAMQTLADQLIDNIEAFAAGRPQNVVVGGR
ncbi:MAG: D-2-hydroxyacid dehydrogenase [Rhodospirillales bacterium]|nr:D-2-hydroxyacid dehydrogenase [Rhodospirillales bacterium]